VVFLPATGDFFDFEASNFIESIVSCCKKTTFLWIGGFKTLKKSPAAGLNAQALF